MGFASGRVGKGGAEPAGAGDHARDAEADVVGALVAEHLRRHAGHDGALDRGRAVRVDELLRERGQEPAVAGPNPTQTMSTSMRWRSTSGRRWLTTGIIQRFGDHDLGQRLGGAVLGQARAGQAAVQLGAQADEGFQAVEAARTGRL